MAALPLFSLNKKQLRNDLEAFHALLNNPAKPNLSEKQDILPFFRSRPHLCAFMGRYNPNIVDYRNVSVAYEFNIFGDHRADLVVGDVSRHAYCLIEFEDATDKSLFVKTPKLAEAWSPRFEHGFSQLVDWILWLENNKGNTAFQTRFNTRAIRYNVLLVIGRDKYLSSPALRERLDWRNEHVAIFGKQCNAITFDCLYRDLFDRAKGIA